MPGRGARGRAVRGRCFCPECGRIVSATVAGRVTRHRLIDEATRNVGPDVCAGSGAKPERSWPRDSREAAP